MTGRTLLCLRGQGFERNVPIVALPPNLTSPPLEKGTDKVVIPGTNSLITICFSIFSVSDDIFGDLMLFLNCQLLLNDILLEVGQCTILVIVDRIIIETTIN